MEESTGEGLECASESLLAGDGGVQTDDTNVFLSCGRRTMVSSRVSVERAKILTNRLLAGT